jgi:hypothetical protein
MSPIVLWMLAISFSSAMMILAVAFDVRLLQFGLGLVIAGFIVLAGVRDHGTLSKLNAFPSHVTATLVRHIGLIYGWAAVSIVLLYGLLLDWPQWYSAFFITTLGATLCLFLANIMMRDLTEMTVDGNIMTLVRSIAKMQFVTTCIALGGLIALGKFSPSTFGNSESWAAINIMICAAFGIAALSGYIVALPYLIEPEGETSDADAAAATVDQTPHPKAPTGQSAHKRKSVPFGRISRPA